jgi:hypothetical protein
MSTQLCVTVTAPTMAELRRRRDEVVGADLIECVSIRSPIQMFLAPWKAAGCRSSRADRPGKAGSSRDQEERRRILEDALAPDADHVDIEWRSEFTNSADANGGTPRRAVDARLWRSARRSDGTSASDACDGAEVIKLAVTTSRLSDACRCSTWAPRSAGTARC